MDQSSGPHALNDFLPDIAAFIKVDGVALLRFLGERDAEDVFAEARLEILQADDACGLGRGFGKCKFLDQRLLLIHRNEESQSWLAR